MNKIYITLLFATFLVVVNTFAQDQIAATASSDQITWYSWEEGVAQVKETKKKPLKQEAIVVSENSDGGEDEKLA